MFRYRHLTRQQINFISDGCGKKGGFLNVPDFIFTASCDQHDINYWIGGTKEDRAKADRQFYQAMLNDANAYPWYNRWRYKVLAWLYYKSVSLFAASFFYHGEQRGYK